MVRSIAVLGAGASLMIGLSLHGCGGSPSPSPAPPAPAPFTCTLPNNGNGQPETPPKPAPTEDVTPLTWSAAEAQAKIMLARMSECDKYLMMQGVKWPNRDGPEKYWYVGNTLGNPDLGIPSLNFNDAAGGFRTYWNDLIGTVTAWPSLLAMAATFQPSLVYSFAQALGEEFVGKGANSVLGPSINVHRVARGGRNFEYLSGEDPFLGAKLADSYVRGVQSKGVMAVMKHFVLNNQETQRNHESSDASDQTKWELYYPPFLSAVNAGASAAMCSYNQENGTQSCSNSLELHRLKNDMNFRGFVQSDWWATHNTTVDKGLDQNMPGNPTESWFDPAHLHKVNSSEIDDSVTRILAAMYRLDVFNRTRCQPPNCKSLVKSNVTSAAHRALARSISAESIVLLKNTGNILPIASAQGSKLAIVGSPADAKPFNPIGTKHWNQGDYYSGGGSGHVTAPNDTVTPLEAIAMRARQAGITVTNDTSNNATSSAALAQEADLTLIFAGTTSGEAQDRANLKLDHHADDLINAVIMACNSTMPKKKVAVLMMIPGAVTMPWHADADLHAIAAQFLGGEGAAGAWVDVLFGDQAPAGRLPVMMPETEADSIAPVNGPSSGYPVVYAEGMGTSYRNTGFNASFPFGHGLTYTSFRYDSVEKSQCNEGEQSSYCISVQITNDGGVAAKAVPQLYLKFPDSAGLVQGRYGLLKGFQKTELIQPGQSTLAKFVLTSDEFSYYSEAAEGFVQVTSAVAHIGESSADIRQNVTFEQVQLHKMMNSEHLVVV